MLTRSRRVIAHTHTQRAPIAHRSSARPTFVDALFLSNDDSSPCRRRETPIESSLVPPDRTHRIRIPFVSTRECASLVVRRGRATVEANASARRRRRATTTRDDDDDGRKNRNSKSLKQTGTMADANLRINVRARVPFADKGA